MSIYPTLDGYTTGRATHIFLTVYEADLSTTFRARSASGVIEIGSTGNYGVAGGVNVDSGYCIFDDDGTEVASGWVENPNAAPTAPIVLPAGGVSPVVTQSFFIKRGDNEPLIFAITEIDSSGNPQPKDVTGWTGNFKLRAQPDTPSILINEPFYISDLDGNVTTDGSLGLLGYDWGRAASRVGETDREGLFLAEFECHRADSTKKTYPTTSDTTKEYIQVRFVPDLDDDGSH